MGTNLLLALLFLLFLPLVVAIGPLIWIIWFSVIFMPEMTNLHGARGAIGSCICYSLSIFVVLPITLAIGMPLGLLAGVFAIIPLYILTIAFIIRIIVYMCCKAKV